MNKNKQRTVKRERVGGLTTNKAYPYKFQTIVEDNDEEKDVHHADEQRSQLDQ